MFVLFVPVVNGSGGAVTTVCDSNGCVNLVPYESLSYAYGGWGLVYDTGVNSFQLGPWVCFCSANHSVPCCGPLLEWVVWLVLGVVFFVDLASVLMIVQRTGARPENREIGGEPEPVSAKSPKTTLKP